MKRRLWPADDGEEPRHERERPKRRAFARHEVRDHAEHQRYDPESDQRDTNGRVGPQKCERGAHGFWMKVGRVPIGRANVTAGRARLLAVAASRLRSE